MAVNDPIKQEEAVAFDDLSRVASVLEERGFSIEPMKRITDIPFAVALYGFREGHSFWKLFPFEDHCFIHDFNDPERNTADSLLAAHTAARAWVDARFSLPKWMRYKVPNIITIAFSDKGFSDEMKQLVSQHAPYGVGGEKHSMYLIDTAAGQLYCAGIERTRGTSVGSGAAVSVSIAPSNINPVNRAYHLVCDLMKI